MKNLSIVAVVLSVAALATALLKSPAAGSGPDESSRALAAAPETDYVAQVEALAAENRDLRERLTALEMRPSEPARAPASDEFATSAELDALREEITAALGGLGSPEASRLAASQRADGAVPDFDAGADPVFTQQVSEALDVIKRQEARDNSQKYYSLRLSNLEEKLTEAAQKLGLTPGQSSDFQAALEGWYEAESQYGVLYAEGMPREEIGEVKAQDWENFYGQLTTTLTPDQLEGYWQLDNGFLYPGSDR